MVVLKTPFLASVSVVNAATHYRPPHKKEPDKKLSLIIPMKLRNSEFGNGNTEVKV